MNAEKIQQIIIESGHKLTSPRREISDWIANHKGVFSASEILAHLKKLDKVSVYRTLELFCSLDIIHEVVTLHGAQHYELHAEENHHHHIVCSGCEKNECIPCDIQKKKFSAFEQVHHSLVFTGLCKPCAK